MIFKKLFRYPPADISQYHTSAVLIVGCLFLIAGSVFVVRIPYLFYQKNRLDSGIQVPAKILWFERVGSGPRRRASTHVKYEFKINDRVYHGDRTSIFTEPKDLHLILRKARQWGREVTCYVDSKDPNFSALNKDVNLSDLFWGLILGIPCALIGSHQLVGYFVAARKSRSKSNTAQRKRSK